VDDGRVLILTPRQEQQIVAQALAEWPNEACGLLGGVAGRVLQVYPATNALHSPVEYVMDARQQISAFLDIEARGWELAGIYHSHPAGPPRPSPTDIARAYYPEAAYLILSLADRARPELRAFHILDGQVREIPVRVENGSLTKDSDV
jgi:proteasome lid subunit RPN8/RPN11